MRENCDKPPYSRRGGGENVRPWENWHERVDDRNFLEVLIQYIEQEQDGYVVVVVYEDKLENMNWMKVCPYLQKKKTKMGRVTTFARDTGLVWRELWNQSKRHWDTKKLNNVSSRINKSCSKQQWCTMGKIPIFDYKKSTDNLTINILLDCSNQSMKI